MKHLLIVLAISLFVISGCSNKSTPAAHRKAPPKAVAAEAVAEQPPPPAKITAKDLKLQTKRSPIKKYNDLSLHKARQEQNAESRAISNSSSKNSKGGAYSHK
ncbi:hypothetical protein C4J81_17055 [Deltaproteobacteria bacterium Smac51]|nr:hypothetical protein C4J81_17055 [Deltaproteobacteria bacterium Smac51]